MPSKRFSVTRFSLVHTLGLNFFWWWLMRQPEVWGHGSVVIFLIIAGILLFGPFFLGSASPPGIPLLLVYPVVLAAVLIFLIVVSRWLLRAPSSPWPSSQVYVPLVWCNYVVFSFWAIVIIIRPWMCLVFNCLFYDKSCYFYGGYSMWNRMQLFMYSRVLSWELFFMKYMQIKSFVSSVIKSFFC